MERFNQEPRKLIRFGNSSYIIALPKYWVVKHKLKKGDLIYVSETENSELNLTAKPVKRTEEKTPIRINIDKKNILEIQREITSAYIGNHTEMIIEGQEIQTKKDMINKIISEKTGIEIAEEDSHRVILKDIFDFESVSFERIIRRMDNIIRSMFEELSVGLKGSTFKEWYYKEIQKADKGANKVYFLILKIIRRCQDDIGMMRRLKVNNKNLADASWFAYQSENIGDEIKRIAKLLTQEKLNSEELENVQVVISILEKEYIETMNAYYKNDKAAAQNVANRKDVCFNSCEKFFKDSSNPLKGNITEKMKGIVGSIVNIAKTIVY